MRCVAKTRTLGKAAVACAGGCWVTKQGVRDKFGNSTIACAYDGELVTVCCNIIVTILATWLDMHPMGSNVMMRCVVKTRPLGKATVACAGGCWVTKQGVWDKFRKSIIACADGGEFVAVCCNVITTILAM